MYRFETSGARFSFVGKPARMRASNRALSERSAGQ